MMLNAFMYISRLCRTGATAYSAFLIHNDTSVICYIMLDVSGIDIQCKVTYLINCGFHSRYCTESPAPVGFDESVVSLNVFRGHTSDVNCATVLHQATQRAAHWVPSYVSPATLLVSCPVFAWPPAAYRMH